MKPNKGGTFDTFDFDMKFNPFDRTHHLPKLARLIYDLQDVGYPEAKGRTLAITLAGEILPELKRRIGAIEAEYFRTDRSKEKEVRS